MCGSAAAEWSRPGHRPVILREVERAGQLELAQGRAQRGDGAFGEGLHAGVEDRRALALEEPEARHLVAGRDCEPLRGRPHLPLELGLDELHDAHLLARAHGAEDAADHEAVQPLADAGAHELGDLRLVNRGDLTLAVDLEPPLGEGVCSA